jgi:hypothetical protein
VKKNFLHGLEIPDFNTLNPAIRVWLDTVANVRTHGETHQRPVDRFEEEKAGLHSLPAGPFDCATVHAVRASSRFRVTYDTNRYSVLAEYASTALSRNLSSSLRAELAATPFEARTRASRLLITKMVSRFRGNSTAKCLFSGGDSASNGLRTVLTMPFRLAVGSVFSWRKHKSSNNSALVRPRVG